MEVRRYTNDEYAKVMLSYLRFWTSHESNTRNVKLLYPEIEGDI